MIPPVPHTAVDVERLALIEHLAKAMQEQAGGVAAAITGGSALRLCHSLPRPSFDLDLDVSARRDWARSVRRALDRSPWRSIAEVDQKQRGRGYIRIEVRPPDSLAWGTKVDVRLCDGVGHPELAGGDCENINGIVTRTVGHIAQRKREKLLGADFRQQGRDLYDYAWLMDSKPEAVSVRDRLDFREWLLGWSRQDEANWRQSLAQDRALLGLDPSVVMEAIYTAMERNPGLQFADAQSAGNVRLAVLAMPSGAVRVGYAPHHDPSKFMPLGTLANTLTAMRFAMNHQLDGGRGVSALARVFLAAGAAGVDLAVQALRPRAKSNVDSESERT